MELSNSDVRNTDQIAYWNGPAGERWTKQQEMQDVVFAPLKDGMFLDHDTDIKVARHPAARPGLTFAGNANLVRHVMVDGTWVVRDFRHRDEERIAARYRDTARRLAESI